jgi:hypothetical protein
MIVAEQKPLEEILETIKDCKRLLLLGCRGCVTVCAAGGQKEVEVLSGLLRLARDKEGRPLAVEEATVERQCDPEFFEEIAELARKNQVVLSMACGAGVQLAAEKLDGVRVLPAVNTLFIGANADKGTWNESCQACGDCKLAVTAGICPVSRCSKSLMNGPCGGSTDGHCELDADTPCGWQLIVERLEAQGLLERYEEIQEPADWSQARDGGPRKVVREDLK